MKNIIVNYKIFNNKISHKNILVLSDLHNYPLKRENDLTDDIKKSNSDLILISGDILQAKKYTKGTIAQKRLKEFLSNISEASPVVLGLGNHDLYGSSKETMRGYKDLESSRPGMVYPLSNESIRLDDVCITDFHPRHSAFLPSNQESGRGVLKFADDYKESGISVSKNSNLFNILLCHNPKLFVQARSVVDQLNFEIDEEEADKLMDLSKKMGNYDLVVSGHMHNGYIPLSMTTKNPSKYMDEGYMKMPIEKTIDGDISKIRPLIFKKTDMCRGTIYVGETDFRIILLSDGTYYLKSKRHIDPVEITEKKALDIINYHNLTPVVINSGVNKYFNLPIDHGEITQVKILKK